MDGVKVGGGQSNKGQKGFCFYSQPCFFILFQEEREDDLGPHSLALLVMKPESAAHKTSTYTISPAPRKMFLEKTSGIYSCQEKKKKGHLNYGRVSAIHHATSHSKWESSYLLGFQFLFVLLFFQKGFIFYLVFWFGATSGSAQELFLALCSRMTPVGAQRPRTVPGTKPI